MKDKANKKRYELALGIFKPIYKKYSKEIKETQKKSFKDLPHKTENSFCKICGITVENPKSHSRWHEGWKFLRQDN